MARIGTTILLLCALSLAAPPVAGQIVPAPPVLPPPVPSTVTSPPVLPIQPRLLRPPGPITVNPRMNTFGDRVKECLHQGGLSNVPGEQMGAFVGACAN